MRAEPCARSDPACAGSRLVSAARAVQRVPTKGGVMLLRDRNAVIYGGGGTIGSAVARAFAREGARVHLAGRTAAKLEAVADEIRAGGGAAETAVLDALD